MKYETARTIVFGILIFALLILLSVIILVNHDWSYTLKLEMDNNTLEAFKSINWSAINQKQCTTYDVNCRNWLYNNGYGRTAEELLGEKA